MSIFSKVTSVSYILFGGLLSSFCCHSVDIPHTKDSVVFLPDNGSFSCAQEHFSSKFNIFFVDSMSLHENSETEKMCKEMCKKAGIPIQKYSELEKDVQEKIDLISESVLLELGQKYETYSTLFDKIVHSENKENFYYSASSVDQGGGCVAPPGFSVEDVFFYVKFKRENSQEMQNIFYKKVLEAKEEIYKNLCTKYGI
ncbi:MAG: hypothetical protein LBI26_01845 [Holosporales bacterium]|jgi:hypothetical protein|nr:hypothetical protein [Holosporales bacterium]